MNGTTKDPVSLITSRDDLDNPPTGATGALWRDSWVECLPAMTSVEYQQAESPADFDEPGVWLFDPALTGDHDCPCDLHREYRRALHQLETPTD